MSAILAGAIIGGATTGGNIAAGAIGNKKRIQAAKDAATKANQRNIENWRRQNAYNDPSQQMARLKAAGLNPNMVYGTGTQAAGQAGSTPSAPAPVPNIQNIKTSGGMEAYTNMQQLGILNAQKLNIEADTQKKKMDTNLGAANWQKQEMENWLQGITQNWATQYGKYTPEELRQQAADGKNPALKAKLAQQATTYSNSKIAEYGIDIANYKSKLAQFGVDTSDDLIMRMAAVYTIENGGDINTNRGLAMAANAVVTLSSMFAKPRISPQRGSSLKKKVTTNKNRGLRKTEYSDIRINN